MNSTKEIADYRDYGYRDARPTHAHAYLVPVLTKLLASGQRRVLDFGCGNGSLTAAISRADLQFVGVDLSETGIAEARVAHPGIQFILGDVTGPLESLNIGHFDVVISCEVVEHLYNPRAWARNCYGLLHPRGTLIVSTPYHGYLKNLLISAQGAWDRHFTALWDGGHIKFWSYPTLRQLLSEAGFERFEFYGAGRAPYLWKSMVIRCSKPR